MWAFVLVQTAFADMRIEEQFRSAITATEQMVWQQDAQSLAQQHGLSLVNVTWEDTGRSKGSVWGPNISDMTIGVRDASGALHPMPVFRFDNYEDKTADLSPDDLMLSVGNERDRALRPVTLTSLLRNLRGYLHDPTSWAGTRRSLLAERDDHVLVSAQACFLPIRRAGEATFTPVIYNYQSSPNNPGVAVIVATREGTSIQLVDNDQGYLSDVLFFNENGERAPFTGVRKSDFDASRQSSGPVAAGNEDGLNVVLLIQVPLKQKEVARGWFDGLGAADMQAAPSASVAKESAGVEDAVIGHGPVEGPFEEFQGLAVERDPRFPVRVTVQFYKATSDGRVTDADVRELRRQIDRVYASGDYVGSLVTDGYTGRPTEWVREPTTNATWSDTSWGWLKSW
jgi:hypothetical protein